MLIFQQLNEKLRIWPSAFRNGALERPNKFCPISQSFSSVCRNMLVQLPLSLKDIFEVRKKQLFSLSDLQGQHTIPKPKFCLVTSRTARKLDYINFSDNKIIFRLYSHFSHACVGKYAYYLIFLIVFP